MQTEVLSHAQRVRRLYKACLVMLKENNIGLGVVPWQDEHLWMSRSRVFLRAEFDKNKYVDPETAVKLVAEGEKKCASQRTDLLLQYPHCPGGSAYGRVAFRPDWMLDTWHPLEKAQYPEYFARRDVRKREFIERWEKKYGKPEPEGY